MAGQTAARQEETYLPTGGQSGDLVDLVEALERTHRSVNRQPRILDSEMHEHALTPQLADILTKAAKALADGQAVTVINRRHLLTTQEAADLINVSRPTLIKILERGEIKFEMRGRHRRIALDDLLAYQHNLDERRTQTLSQMQRQSQDDGLYDLDRLTLDALTE